MAFCDHGGYDYSFVDKDLERFTCNVICTKVLRDPHLTGCCGQHFCEFCLNNWFIEKGKKSCPYCRAKGKAFKHFLNKSLKREIDSLRIYCTNKEEGCQWVGELGSLRDHLESDNGCGYVKVECPNKCWGLYLFSGTKKIMKKELENHLKNECYLRLHQCEYCGYMNTYAAITGSGSGLFFAHSNHYNVCPEYPIKCSNWPHCDAKDIKRKDMGIHLLHCPEEEVECPFKCKVKSKSSHHCLKPSESIIFSLKRKYVTRHIVEDCVLRPYQCEHCGLKDTYDYIVSRHCHFDCPEILLECPNKCGVEDIKRKDMRNHRSQCPEEPVQCPFAEAGCKQYLVRHELEQHMSTTQQQHVLMLMGAYKEVKKTNEELKKDNAEMKEAYRVMNKELRAVKQKLTRNRKQAK